jgi:hypothetical protein
MSFPDNLETTRLCCTYTNQKGYVCKWIWVKWCSVLLYLQLFVEWTCLIYVICVCLRNTYCVVLCFFFVCLRLVYPVLPVSLSCQFFIVPSVFSNVFHRLFNFTCTRNLKEQCFIVVLFFTDVCNFVNLTHDCCY